MKTDWSSNGEQEPGSQLLRSQKAEPRMSIGEDNLRQC